MMKRIIIFGYCFYGILVADQIRKGGKYEFRGFADNSPYKQGKTVSGYRILGIIELRYLCENEDIGVIIVSNHYESIIEQCLDNNIPIEGVFIKGRLSSYPFADFSRLDLNSEIRLYAGEICDEDSYHMNDPSVYALSLGRHDDKHIIHNILNPYPLPDCSIASYEAECVFEYIEYDMLPTVINEIWRILKSGGILRICLPDYNSNYLKERTMLDDDGKLYFDAGCGGYIDGNGVKVRTSSFFPTYRLVDSILETSKFSNIEWLCYYSNDGVLHRTNIDESRGHVQRVMGREDKDIYCMVVDCCK